MLNPSLPQSFFSRFPAVLTILLVCAMTQAAEIQSTQRTILCFGDSITANGHWLEVLEAETPHRFINAGRGGRRAAHAPGELAAALEAHPEADSLLVMIGVNDLPARDPRPGAEKVANCVAAVEAALRDALLRMPPWNILLVAPPTVHPERLSDVNRDKGYGVTPPLLRDLEAGYRELAQRLGAGFFSMRERIDPAHYRDGLHPDRAGEKQIAAALSGWLNNWRQPAVHLVGDSISINYHETLTALAEGNYEYTRKGGLAEAEANLDQAVGANGGDSARVLSYLDQALGAGIINAPYLVVNCGLHDIKTESARGSRQVELADYRNNLQALVRRVRLAGKQLIWITTTPVDEARHQRFSNSFHRYEADLAAYNRVAAEIMESARIPVIDLYAFTIDLIQSEGDPFRDHVHFRPDVSERQGAFVNKSIIKYLKTNYTEPSPLPDGEPVRGWNILSDSLEDGLRVIERAPDYGINHLQLSHEIVHDLRHIDDPARAGVAHALTGAAHLAGIREVVLWDRLFYELDYYPERFRTGPKGTLNLDDPQFWEWLKADYRRMLDRSPDIQGLIMTFIETRTRIEHQHSEAMTTDAEKLARAVSAVAEVVIGERGLNLYARTFAYYPGEYDRIVSAVEQFSDPQIRIMIKETPHDFFLTHPNNPLPGRFERGTLVEFDITGEFNGQGLIANTWPEYVLQRAGDLLQRPHVIGYVARTDRYGRTRLIDQPGEINLLALKRFMEDPRVTPEAVTEAFIAEHYGEAALIPLKRAFSRAYEIVASSLYTLGTNTANHSKLNFDPYVSSYARHVSGKWIQPPVVMVGHGVEREFHYWTEVVEHLAPSWAKAGGAHLNEVPEVVEAGWLTPKESINAEYLGHVLTEKAHGVAKAEAALADIEAAREVLAEADYGQLRDYFTRTLLTARLHQAAAGAYWGYRVWARGGEHRSEEVVQSTRQSLLDMRQTAREIREFHAPPAQGGQWNWLEDAEMARTYWRWIVVEGWPTKNPSRQTVPDPGLRFPMDDTSWPW
jgi:lysophospholipase L1-like esterase